MNVRSIMVLHNKEKEMKSEYRKWFDRQPVWITAMVSGKGSPLALALSAAFIGGQECERNKHETTVVSRFFSAIGRCWSFGRRVLMKALVWGLGIGFVIFCIVMMILGLITFLELMGV